MPSIHLRGLTYAHTVATTVLRDATVDLASHPGRSWVGVVGANGAGKTTLLQLLAGRLQPTSGEVSVHAEVPPLLVEQEVTAPTGDIQDFAWSWDGVAERLRSRLELDPDDLDPELGRGWHALSPGQRERWQVATALASGADVLLLDEPTNHLDVVARDLLLDALEGFQGLGLIVSHDRQVLDRLTDRTLRIHRGGVELHTGGYTEASRRWRGREAGEREAHERARREERRVRRQLADARRSRAATERGSAAARRSGVDPEARSMGARFRAASAEQAHAKRIAATRSKLERVRGEVDSFDLQREHGGSIGFQHVGSRRRRLAAVRGDIAHAGGDVWLRAVDVELDAGEHVRVDGANGAGKTTLVRAVETALAAAGETVVGLPQELPDPGAELARLHAADHATRGRILGVVALLGVDPDRVLVTDAPSPGEVRKLALAGALAGDASVLVLDEPTNHLDLPSIERLEEALAAWAGALLLVTHDERLAAAVTHVTWRVHERRVTRAPVEGH